MAKLLRRMRSTLAKGGLSEDDEFDTLVKIFEDTETRLQVIAGASRHYAEAVRSMTMAQKSLASAVDSFYSVEPAEDESNKGAKATPMNKLQAAFSDSAVAADDDAAKRVHEISLKVTEETQAALELFKPLHERLALRKKKLVDYEHYRNKVKALAEKSPDDPQKLPRNQAKLSEAKKEYDEAHAAALEGLERLLSNREQLMDPQLAQLAQAHLLLTEGTTKPVQTLSKLLGSGEVKKAVDSQVVAMKSTADAFAAEAANAENEAPTSPAK